MATDIDWPENLRPAIRNTKTIQQAAGFRESSAAVGAPYTEHFTDDQPTYVSFDLKFTQSENQKFDVWIRSNNIFKYGRTFNFPVNDEYGLTYQEARFTSGGVPSWSENGAVKTLSGCQIIIPNYIKPDADLVFSFFDVYGGDLNQLSQLDIMINQNWPEES